MHASVNDASQAQTVEKREPVMSSVFLSNLERIVRLDDAGRPFRG